MVHAQCSGLVPNAGGVHAHAATWPPYMVEQNNHPIGGGGYE